MKHIKYFETQAERDATIMIGPMIAYTKETDKLEIEGDTPINTLETPTLMAKMYEWGWASNPYYMTVKECASVTNQQLASKHGSSSSNSQFAGCSDDFSAFKYFTSITSIPTYAFKGCSFKKIRFPNTINTIANASCLTGGWIKGTLDLSNTKITALPEMYIDSNGNKNNNMVGIILPETCNRICDPSNGSGCFSWSVSRTASMQWLRINYTGTDLVALSRAGLGGGHLGSMPSTFRIYVPDELLEAYKTDTYTSGNERYEAWSIYASKIYPNSQWQSDVDNGVISYNDFAK